MHLHIVCSQQDATSTLKDYLEIHVTNYYTLYYNVLLDSQFVVITHVLSVLRGKCMHARTHIHTSVPQYVRLARVKRG